MKRLFNCLVSVANTLAGVLLWHILMPGGLLWMSAMQLMMATLLFICVAIAAWYVWAEFLDKR